MKNNDFDIKPFSPIRKLSIDSTRLSKKRNYIHGLIDVDIQALSDLLRKEKQENK